MNSKDKKSVISFFESLWLPEDQIAVIKDYIAGKAGDEALEKLGFKDLTSLPDDKSYSLAMFSFVHRKLYDEARMFFKILFAISECTCHNIMPYLVAAERDQFLDEEISYKYLAVYANKIAAGDNWLDSYYILGIEEMPVDLEQYRKAIAFKHNTSEGTALLLAMYFKKKYTDKVIENNAQIHIEEEDLLLFAEYERIMLSSLEKLLDNQLEPSAIDEIKVGIREESIDKIRPLVHKNASVTTYMMKLVGGLSYLNFPISTTLKNIVSLCFAINSSTTLDAVNKISYKLNISIKKIGGDFDKFFGIDSREYILWAAREANTRAIFARQLQTNRDIYLSIIKEGINDGKGNETPSILEMIKVVMEEEPDLFNQINAERTKDGNNEDELVIANQFKANPSSDLNDEEREEIKDYILGKETIDTIYPFADRVGTEYHYATECQRLARSYRKTYGDCELLRRCAVIMLFGETGFYINNEMQGRQQQFFEELEMEKVTAKYQLSVIDIVDPYIHNESKREEFIQNLIQTFTKYLKEKREETLSAFRSASALGRWLGLTVMKNNPNENKEEILACANDSAKLVKELLFDIVCEQKNWEEDVKKLLSAKKAGGREFGVRVLTHWQSENAGTGVNYTELFSAALEKEKNAKVMALLQDALKIGSEDAPDTAKAISNDDLVAQLHKGGKKRTLAWAYETPFPVVHKTNGEEADEEYLQAILLCYSSAEKNGISLSAASLAKALNADELAAYVNELYEKWIKAGADAKKRWVLCAAAIHGGADIVWKLPHQILAWAQNSRGAIAADAVGALALNPLPQALLTVDSISRKYKFKQVKAAAGEALEFAASQLGISKEELADRIVPNLGFDENMERIFDYGGRRFKVTVTTALELEVFDESGKKLKSLPSVGKKDEPEMAEEAYEEFKQLKKQIKTVVSSQQSRLEYALSVKREWSMDAWKALFVKNPIMHRFAIGLIWGIYEDGKLTRCFRYMEDGTFNTEDGEEYTLPESGQTGLIHPTELTEASLSNWKQQLEDYEIKQPIEQLDRPVYMLTDEEKEQKKLNRFDGCTLNSLSLNSKLLGMGWYRGSVQDAGYFDTYYREDVDAGLGVELHFSGSFVDGHDSDEDVTVYDARFYKAGTIERGSYCYDEADDNKSIILKDIPPGYFSEIVLQLTKVTAASQNINED